MCPYPVHTCCVLTCTQYIRGNQRRLEIPSTDEEKKPYIVEEIELQKTVIQNSKAKMASLDTQLRELESKSL